MGIFEKFKIGFQKSASNLAAGLKDIILKKEIDDKTLDNIEDFLISSDVGVESAHEIKDIISNKKIDPKKNCVIGFGITEKTISKLKKADGLVVGSAICKEITKSLDNRQNPVINVSKLVEKLKNKIS